MKQETVTAPSASPLPDEIMLGAALRGPTRKPVYLRIAGWCMIVGCALSMATILASTPKVTQKLSTLAEQFPAATKVDTTALAPAPDTGEKNPEFNADGTPLAAPGKLLSALGSLSRSARGAMGYGDPMDFVDVPPDQRTAQSNDGFDAFFATAEEPAPRPAVSRMPQNRIPVRRAGISN